MFWMHGHFYLDNKDRITDKEDRKRFYMEDNMKKKVPAKFTEMMTAALGIHQMTQGAPVEVRDGTRVVKIGPWPSGDIMQHIKAFFAHGVEFIQAMKANNPDPTGLRSGLDNLNKDNPRGNA